MTLMERLSRQRKVRSPTLHAISSNKNKASDKECSNISESPGIKASLESYPTPKGRNLRVVLKLEKIPEIPNLEIAQSSILPSVKPTENATENMDYHNRPSDASSVNPRNERVNRSANHPFRSSGICSIESDDMYMSEEIDDSLRDLSWILLMPGLFPMDSEETLNPSPLRLDDPTSSTPHTSVEQSSISPSVNRGLPFQEKPPSPMPPHVLHDYDAKTKSYSTVSSQPDFLYPYRVPLPQENLAQPSPSNRSQTSLPKDIERPTTDPHQQQLLAVTGERNTDEPSSQLLRPSRAPPAPPKPDNRQPVLIAIPPPKPPPPPWKTRDPDKRPSIQIDSSLQRPSRHPEIPPEPEIQAGSRESKRPITQRVFRGCKKFIGDALRLSRSSLCQDSANSSASSQIGADHTQAATESIKGATQNPQFSASQSKFSSSISYKKSLEKGEISTNSSRNSDERTNSAAPSAASKAAPFLSRATSFKLKTKLSQFFSRKDHVRGDKNRSEVSPDLPAIEGDYLLPELELRPSTLLPFQCTMCLMLLNNKTEWIEHEQQRHNNGYDDVSDRYWRCGFCDNILHSWDDRQNHIANDHFGIGQTLSSWNSSTSPYPWDKLSSKPISGFPRWDISDISMLQSLQPTILDDIYRTAEPRNACGVCNLAFATPSGLDQHMEHNHVRWFCPTIKNKGKATSFFEKCRNGCINQFHSCRFCHMPFCSDSADWKLRNQHFEEYHQFLECDHDEFFEHAQFCHHLASSHDVEIDYLGVTELCRQKDTPQLQKRK